MRVRLAPQRRVVDAPSRAAGEVRIDLLAGRVDARVSGLPPGVFELWLVDPRPGPRAGAAARPAAVQVLLGTLARRGDLTELRAEPGPALFERVRLGAVVIAPAGSGPRGGLLHSVVPLLRPR